MSAGGDGAAGARGLTLFDALVDHERGERNGTAPSLRPRLPYLFEDAPPEPEREIDAPEPLAAAPRTSPHPVSQPTSASRGGRDAPSAPVLREPVAATIRSAAEPAAAHRRAQSGPAAATGEGPPDPPRASDREVRLQPHPEARSPALEPHAPAAIERSSPRPRPAQNRRLPDEPAAAAHSPPRLAGLRRGAAPVRDEPVIEISIGRIDIRAAAAPGVQASQPAPAKPRGDRLAAYLERRSRGSRS